MYQRIYYRPDINATMRPAAGIVGLVAHPIQGAWKSMQKTWAKEQESQQRTTRVSYGVDTVKSSTKGDRDKILENFKQAKTSTKEREKQYRNAAEKVFAENEDIKSDSPPPTASSAPYADSTISSPTIPPRPHSTSQGEEAAFEKDLELATQLSLAEQRGYEPGLSNKFGSD